FTLSAVLTTGSNPRSVAAADINADGKIDLICANFGANTLTVFTNDGAGNFALASTIPTSAGPYAVIAADINADGKVDLVTANTMTILTNNGTGGFVVAISPSVGLAPVWLTAADVNGDGRLDLVAANQNGNNFPGTLTVLTNTGGGDFFTPLPLFMLASSPIVANGPMAVAAGDLNGDGVIDLAVASGGGNSLSILFGDRPAHFTGVGDGLAALNADYISSGTLTDARLSANVPRLVNGK